MRRAKVKERYRGKEKEKRGREKSKKPSFPFATQSATSLCVAHKGNCKGLVCVPVRTNPEKGRGSAVKGKDLDSAVCVCVCVFTKGWTTRGRGVCGDKKGDSERKRDIRFGK